MPSPRYRGARVQGKAILQNLRMDIASQTKFKMPLERTRTQRFPNVDTARLLRHGK